jgi:hypothetical protein
VNAAMPYTHWMYFEDRDAAERCAAELTRLDFLCGVDFSPEMTPQEHRDLIAQHPALAGLPVQPTGDRWLLRAARDVEIDDLIDRHGMVEAIVVRHGGTYDGGESGWMDPRTGEFLRQAEDGQ